MKTRFVMPALLVMAGFAIAACAPAPGGGGAPLNQGCFEQLGSAGSVEVYQASAAEWRATTFLNGGCVDESYDFQIFPGSATANGPVEIQARVDQCQATHGPGANWQGALAAFMMPPQNFWYCIDAGTGVPV